MQAIEVIDKAIGIIEKTNKLANYQMPKSDYQVLSLVLSTFISNLFHLKYGIDINQIEELTDEQIIEIAMAIGSYLTEMYYGYLKIDFEEGKKLLQ